MGRKSRIARGLDISAAAKKMMEKATGTVLTDEEYFALEHQALKRPIERNLEDFERVLTHGEFPVQEEWWMPYAQPLPTWDITGYPTALGILRVRPVSDKLREPDEQGWSAGIYAGEGTSGIVHDIEARVYYPFIQVGMMERPDVDRLAELLGLRTYHDRKIDKYVTSPRGLRCIVTLRIWLPHLTEDTRRKEAGEYLIQKGIRLTKEIHDQFLTKFRAKRGTIRLPAGSPQMKELPAVYVGRLEEE